MRQIQAATQNKKDLMALKNVLRQMLRIFCLRGEIPSKSGYISLVY